MTQGFSDNGFKKRFGISSGVPGPPCGYDRPMSEVLDLTRDLIMRPSVTPDDAGCQPLVAERLRRAGFACEHLRFGEVDHLWATHGPGDPVPVLLCNPDVVPPGPREAWTRDTSIDRASCRNSMCQY